MITQPSLSWKLLSVIGTLLCLSVLATGVGVSAAKVDQVKGWEWLRKADPETLQSLWDRQNSPRAGLMLAIAHIDSDVDTALTLLKQVAGARAGGDESVLADVLMCSFSELQGTRLSSEVCDARGASIAQIEHPLPASFAHLHFGIWLALNGHFKRSFQANRYAEEIALTAGDARLAATSMNNQGVDYLFRGLPVQALTKFQRALEHLQASGLTGQQSFLNLLTSNIASAHLELGQLESADKLLQSVVSDELYDRNNPVNLFDEVLLARSMLAQGRPQMGYERLSAVLEEIGERGVVGAHAYAHAIMGQLKIALGNTDAGIASFRRAQEFGKRSAGLLRLSKVELEFAEVLVELKRFDEATALIDKSITELGEHGPSMILAQALDLRADVLQALDQRRLASAVKREANQLRSEVLGAEHDMNLAILGKSLELATQANELASAQQQARVSEERAQRQITFRNQLVVTGVLLAMIVYLVLSRRYARKVAQTIQEANADLEIKVAERTCALEQEMAQRLEAESERQALAGTLAEAEKLQAMGQLTSGVAHDFNNLMTVVTLSAGQLQDSGETMSAEGRQHVDNILSATESASDITASLLAYARKQPLAPETTDLGAFITESLPLFESTLGEGIVLQTDIKPCTISVDRSQLTTAIINLLLNAKEALSDVGMITLEVGELYDVSESGEEQVWAAITVTDHGVGMSATELQRATQPFFTTKAVGQGTGLGLSMVDGFAKQSGGFLQMDSLKDERTVVTLHIPLSSETEQKTRAHQAQSARLPDQGLVMIVDDQQSIRDVLSRLLVHMGLNTLCASDASEALKLLEDSARPDLLITDLMMPGELNGQQLAAEVRKRYSDLPVLIISGYSNSVELDVEFLHKPFTLDGLREAIGRAIVHDRVA